MQLCQICPSDWLIDWLIDDWLINDFIIIIIIIIIICG